MCILTPTKHNSLRFQVHHPNPPRATALMSGARLLSFNQNENQNWQALQPAEELTEVGLGGVATPGARPWAKLLHPVGVITCPLGKLTTQTNRHGYRFGGTAT